MNFKEKEKKIRLLRRNRKSMTYSIVSGRFWRVINIQLVKIVSITNVLKSECVNIRIDKRRIQLNGQNIKQDRVELNRNILLFRLITTNAYDFKK